MYRFGLNPSELGNDIGLGGNALCSVQPDGLYTESDLSIVRSRKRKLTTLVRAPIGVGIFWNRHFILLMSFEHLSRDLLSEAELLGTRKSHPVTHADSRDRRHRLGDTP